MHITQRNWRDIWKLFYVNFIRPPSPVPCDIPTWGYQFKWEKPLKIFILIRNEITFIWLIAINYNSNSTYTGVDMKRRNKGWISRRRRRVYICSKDIERCYRDDANETKMQPALTQFRRADL